MSEMVERVARALAYEIHGECALKDWPQGFAAMTDTRMDADDLRAMGRAAIAAMREPTEEMIEAGAGPCADQHYYKSDTWLRKDFLSEETKQDYRNGMKFGYRAMIDAALKNESGA